MTCTSYQISYSDGQWWLLCTDEGEVFSADTIANKEDGINLAMEYGATSIDVFNKDGSWDTTMARVTMKGTTDDAKV